MPHFKLLAAIAVAPQSMLSHCFAIPYTLKVRGDYVKIFAFQKNHPFKLCYLFFEKGYFNGVPILPGQGEQFPLNTAWIYYFSLMNRATATHTYGVF